MIKQRCAACGKRFLPRPQSPHQAFCSDPACQRERRRRWQLTKRQNDPDYQDNQARAQAAWLAQNPDYWRKYRADHPDYVAHNRELQRSRNKEAGQIAKMDASPPRPVLSSGLYQLKLLAPRPIAKMDPWIARITVVSRGLDPGSGLQREDVIGKAAVTR